MTSDLSVLIGKLDKLYASAQAGEWYLEEVEDDELGVGNTGNVLSHLPNQNRSPVQVGAFDWNIPDAAWTVEAHNAWPELKRHIHALRQRCYDLESLASDRL